MKEEIKGLYWAIFLSAVAVLVINWLWPNNPQSNVVEETDIQVAEQVKKPNFANDEATLYSPKGREIATVEDALLKDRRVTIKNNKIAGSLRLKGARFDSLNLLKYKQSLAEDSEAVVLLQPSGTQAPYYAEFGWLGKGDVVVPDQNTQWKLIGQELTPSTPILLEWNNGQGIKFLRKISVDENYMFTIEQMVENKSGRDITLYPYGMINKVYIPDDNSSKVVHEGMLGVVDGSLKEIAPNKFDAGESKEFESKSGWAGFGERYWFSAFVLNNDARQNKVRFSKTAEDTFQTDFVGAPLEIETGSIGSSNVKFYAGAKEIALLDEYEKKQGIDKFDLAVDFGWYYFLTKPFFYILDFLYHIIGNMGWAILLFAALLRLVMFPVANKSYESMSKMKKVQPKIQAIQQTYSNDKMRQQQAMMELYRKEKINPASGCLPMFIQIPVFFSLYKVLNIAIEIRHAPFIGWIKDLSAPDPMTLSAMSGLPIPAFLDLGVWPILMGLTMYMQQKLSPKPANKDQARMMMLLPIVFTFMLGHFASGLVIYWTLSNVLSIIQQKAIMYKFGVK